MPDSTHDRGQMERPDAIHSISVHFQDGNFAAGAPTQDTNVPVLRFPGKGRVVGARLIPHGTVAAGTVNYKVGLFNRGSDATPAGTIRVAAQVGGADGVTAGTPLAMTIDRTDDNDVFEAGEWLALNVTLAGDATVDFSVAIDYRLYAS